MAKVIGQVNPAAARKLELDAAPFWNHEEAGDTIAGRVVSITKATSKKYPTKGEFTVLIIEAGGSLYKVDCGGAVLARLLAENPVTVGCELAVQYLGEGKAKEGQKPCQRYALAVSTPKK